MASELAKLLGRRVRALREARGWNAADLAHEAGMSERGIFYVEKGTDRDPSLATMVKLATALDVAMADLLGDERGDLSPAVETLVNAARELPGEAVDLLTAVASRMAASHKAETRRPEVLQSSPPRGANDIQINWGELDDVLTDAQKARIQAEIVANARRNERMPRINVRGNGDDEVQESGASRRHSG